MITNSEQFSIALKQLASFKGMLEGMQLHLQETQPQLIPLISGVMNAVFKRYNLKFAIFC
jgi:hypothetical protein